MSSIVPSEFLCPEPVTDFQQKGDRIGVVGDEKEWRDLLQLRPNFEGRARIRTFKARHLGVKNKVIIRF